MITIKKLFAVTVLFISLVSGLFAQSLSVGKKGLDEYFRREQLLGAIDSSLSFTVKPLSSAFLNRDNLYDPTNSLKTIRRSSYDGIFEFDKKKGKFQLLPVSTFSQFNSHHPEGINDGLMIPARGVQLRLDVGFYFKYSLFELTFNPEFVYAQNKSFDGFPAGYKTTMNVTYPSNPYQGRIDLPERFGGSFYRNTTLGQSSVRLTYKSVSFGLSNENLWWGPGYKNSLLMTNSASGFKHLTLNTVRPIKTFLGSFEGQLISGRLEGSVYTDGLRDDWRYLNAMVFSYGPKWIPGLFMGFSRSFMVYNEDMGTSFDDYLPVFGFLSKKSVAADESNEDVDAKNRNQIISVFMRWLFHEANGEIYFEYGREDHAWDKRDFILEPSHSAAYILGLRKLFISKKNPDNYIQLIGEITHLSSNQTTINRKVGVFGNQNNAYTFTGWYLHDRIKHGYTNEGQMLGAGIGPTSNMQTLSVSWNKGLKQIGLEFDRYVHNNDFWRLTIKDMRTNWVDRSTTLFANWDYQHFLLFGKLKFVQSINYQWLFEPPFVSHWGDSETMKNTFNLHAQLGITYRF